MPKPIIAITRNIPQTGIKLLRQKGYALRLNTTNSIPTKPQLKTLVQGCHAILSTLTERIDAEILENAGLALKIIANFAVGFDNIDLAEAKKRHVAVTNTPSPSIITAVAEHTMMLILACAKRLIEADRFTRLEKYQGWNPALLLGMELAGKTIGIIGPGRIGASVAKMASLGFGMKTLYNDRERHPEFEAQVSSQYASLPTLLKKSDVITLHVPLLPETRHLIASKELGLMKRTAILINTSRGPVIEEKALLKALKNKKIMATGLDVYECEPAIDCDIRDNLEFKSMRNVVMTPHTASATIEARNDMSILAAKNIIAALSGKKVLNPI